MQEMFSLAAFEQLRSLIIRGGNDENWESLSYSLQSISSRLEELFISIFVVATYPLAAEDEGGGPGFVDEGLESLDSVLKQKQFAHLRVVEFYLRQVYVGSLSTEQKESMHTIAVAAFRAKLPDLFKRAAVRIIIHRYVPVCDESHRSLWTVDAGICLLQVS